MTRCCDQCGHVYTDAAIETCDQPQALGPCGGQIITSQEAEEPMEINALARDIHDLAMKKGWYDANAHKTDVENLMMIVTEVAEATEEMRKEGRIFVVDAEGRPHGVLVELADVAIRTLDMMQHLIERDNPVLTVEKVILAKHEFNKGREHQHGKKF